MNKFLIYDKSLEVYRLPLSYSLGDLDRIRNIFGEHSLDASIALPQLPPHIEAIDDKDKFGYLVYPPFDINTKTSNFLSKTVLHVRELKGTGYDYQHPLFKGYLLAREEAVRCLAESLEFVVAQERRLGIFNVYWLAVTKQIVNCLDEILIKTSGSQKLRYMIHPHLKSMLNQVLDQVFDKLEYRDSLTRQNIPFYRGTLKSKLGENFNFNFVNDIINVQLSLLESSISPLDPLFQIRRILVDENSEYYISYDDFVMVYESIMSWLEGHIREETEWVMKILSQVLGIPQARLNKLNLNTIIFEPQIMFTLQETLKQIPVKKTRRGLPIRKKTLIDEIGREIWNQVLLDFIKLARELQKAEIISYFRDRVTLLGKEQWKPGSGTEDRIEGLENRITYNFHSGTVINDLRQVTLLFIDLRGFTQIASGLIPVRKLKESLYEFFDPTLDIIDHFLGQIRFFAGDAVLATFSDKCSEQDRVLNAVRVGIYIQNMLRHLVTEKQLPFEGVGIGIHVGKVENAYIFKNSQDKIDTVIGLAANITSRLSSGKSTTSEHRGDPALIREFQDILQDVLERIKGKVTPNLKTEIIQIFEDRLNRFSSELSKSDAYVDLPKFKKSPGQFKVHVVGGVLDNNGIALSDEAFSEFRNHHELRSRPGRDGNIEFVFGDAVLEQEIVFTKVGDALLKGIEVTVPVWGVFPAVGRKNTTHETQ
ncbi:adenylate/guanylate cyclase domain-containing protein [bacterium]|nr:adenylate/guanylate cyclase domain-containing protein [candidate division CSSED10-310 bacterium]